MGHDNPQGRQDRSHGDIRTEFGACKKLSNCSRACVVSMLVYIETASTVKSRVPGGSGGNDLMASTKSSEPAMYAGIQ